MASNDVILRLSVEPLFTPVDLSGEVCILCEEQIFGSGFSVVMAINIEGQDLPGFSPTTAHYCQSCKPDLKETQ